MIEYCSYCGEVTTNPEVEHVIPKSAGGGDSCNTIPACYDCNRWKGTKSLVMFLFDMGTAIDQWRAIDHEWGL